VIYPGSTPVGNATLVVANVLTCNKHSPITFSACTEPQQGEGTVTVHLGKRVNVRGKSRSTNTGDLQGPG
jgi:hypothetical protein